MSSNMLGLIELVLVFGGVLGFGIYQLWSVKRDLRKSREQESRKSE